MRLIVGILVLAALSGCVEEPLEEGFAPSEFPLTVYRHAWAGSDVHVPGAEHGIAFSVFNPTDVDVHVGMILDGTSDALMGPIGSTEGAHPVETWMAVKLDGTQGAGRLLAAGEGTLFLAKVTAYESTNISAKFLVSDPIDLEVLYESKDFDWTITEASGDAVDPGMLVQTRTVGLWTNGTSFYTNSGDLLADPAFPAGGNVDRSADTGTLPVYVYGSDPSEQPLGNGDNCYFTTIAGYNGLLGRQNEFSTGVTLMQPSQAYTRDGNEDHLLYGDTLVFLNTIVAVDGTTSLEDELPDPTGACFDPQRAVGKVTNLLPEL